MTTAARPFRYRALTRDGDATQGTVLASDEQDARSSLARQGLLPTSLRSDRFPRATHARPSARDVATGFRILADLLGAGLTVARALDAFADLCPEPWSRAIPSLRESVRQGKGLSEALSLAPIRVPALLLGMVRAGEHGDGLTAALRRAAEHAERSSELRAALRGSLAYPIVIAVTGAISIGVMLMVVLPRFATLLADLGQDLPASTRRLMLFSEIAQTVVPVALVMVTLFAGFLIWSRSHSGASRAISRALLSTPLAGDLWRGVLDARIASTLAALLGSGSNVRQALRLAGEASGDVESAARLAAASDGVSRGESLSTALATQQAVGAATARLIRTGEQTGRVAELCDRAAALERDRVDRQIRAAVRLIEPAVILVFAGIVGFVAIALLQAVYAVRPG